MFVGIELLKIDSISNEMAVQEMMGTLDDEPDKYWR
jgi:hypothetical protein